MNKSFFASLTVSLFILASFLTGCALPQNQAVTNPGETTQNEAVTINVAGLKGPTTIGILHMTDRDKAESSEVKYNYSMYVSADEILPKVVSGEVDIALIPANAASILYNKTKGAVSVIDINTLGVLYAVSYDDSIKTISDLAGRKILLTGKGTIPDATIRFLLEENGIENAELEFKSEPSEVAAILKEDESVVGILPQPFATTLCAQDERIKTVLSLSDEWDSLNNGSRMITGVTIVRREFAEQYPEAVAKFLEDHKESAALAISEQEKTAQLIAQAGIIPDANLARKAIDGCNITYIDGDELQTALSGYLQALYGFDASLVGGTLPEDDFYYAYSEK